MSQYKVITLEQYQRKKMFKTLLNRLNQPLPPKTTRFMIRELNHQQFHMYCHNLYQAINQYLLVKRKYNPYFMFDVTLIDDWLVWSYQQILELLQDHHLIYDNQKYNLIQLTTHLFDIGLKQPIEQFTHHEKQRLFQNLIHQNIQ